MKSKKHIERRLASLIDYTVLKADATENDIKKLCREAKKYHFASVCVNPIYVVLARTLLKGSVVKICTVVGFPLGANTQSTKTAEAMDAISNGADEVDMVINIGALKNRKYRLVLDDIKAVRKATQGKVLKVILETVYLTSAEKIKACQLSQQAGADFVKTSTGFGPAGAKVSDVQLMKKTVGNTIGIKAAGGIRTVQDAKKMIGAGATRIGTSEL